MGVPHRIGRHDLQVRTAIIASWVLAMFGVAGVFGIVYLIYGDGTLPDHAIGFLIGTIAVTSAWILGTMAIGVVVGIAQAIGFLTPGSDGSLDGPVYAPVDRE